MTDSPPVWLLRTILPETRAPAPGVPVTLLDELGNAAGYWVSDANGLVSIPRGDATRLRLRVGLRSETPIELAAEALTREIVELEAPRSLLPAPRRSTAVERPAPGGGVVPLDLPGQVLHFARVALLPVPRAPEMALLPPPGGGHDFLATTDLGPSTLRYGALVEVEQYWQPLGQIAGDLLYSVALPPGDQAQVGIVDERWHSPDGAPPGRPLEVLARLIAAPGLAPPERENTAALPLEPLTLTPSSGPAGGFTVAAVETIRYLNERAVRMSQVLRRRPLRVVEGLPGRTLRNPTSDRAVSYHFYEPLERYRVTARAARIRPALLVPFHLPSLATRGMVRQYGHLLRRALLDRSLEAALDRLLSPTPPPATAAAPPVSELRLIVERAHGGKEGEHATDLRRIWCFLHADTSRYAVHFFPSDAVAGVDAPTDTPHWIGAIRLADFHERPLPFPAALSLQNGSPALLRFREIHIEGRAGARWVRLHTVRDLVLPPQSQVPLAGLAALADASPAGGDPEEGRLLAHIAANIAYYAAAVIAGGDPAVRYLALAAVRDPAGYALADVCENTVAGVVGNWLAFPLKSPEFAPAGLRAAVEQYAARPARVPDETVVTIPVPGLWLSVQGAEAAEPVEEETRSVLHRPAPRRR